MGEGGVRTSSVNELKEAASRRISVAVKASSASWICMCSPPAVATAADDDEDTTTFFVASVQPRIPRKGSRIVANVLLLCYNHYS